MVDVAHDLGNLGPTGRGLLGAAGHARQGRPRDGQLLQDLRLERRLRRRARAQREGISALLQLAQHLLQRACRRPARRSSARRSTSSARRKARSCAAADGQHPAAAQPARAAAASKPMATRRRSSASRWATRRWPASPRRRLPALGLLANLVEFPAVPKGQARFRLQVMAKHSRHDILDAVHRLSTAVADATDDVDGAGIRVHDAGEAQHRPAAAGAEGRDSSR